MEVKCTRCRQKISSDDFLCPHCGAIIGQTAAGTVGPRSHEGRKPWRKAVIALLAVAVMCAVGTGIWLLAERLMDGPPAPRPTTTSTEPATAPLRVYTVTVTVENGGSLSGTLAHVYLDGVEVYNAELSSSGVVTFILPENDGYSIRFSQLPVAFQYNYGDVEYTFSAGERWLEISLIDQPVPYVVTVVNSAGEPIPDVGVNFSSNMDETQLQLTDEQGQCTFMSMYAIGKHWATVRFVPNGYVEMQHSVGFRNDSLEVRLVLQTWEEAGEDPETVHTVRVLDENDQPASGVSLYLQYMDNDSWLPVDVISGVTNQDGCYSFAWSQDGGSYSIQVKGRIDSGELRFVMQEDERELVIQLPPEPEHYTHTVTIRDQFGEPVQRALIVILTQEGAFGESFLTGENGQISFTTAEKDPSQVRFCLYNVPDNYNSAINGTHYSFPSHTRDMELMIAFTGKVDYTVKLLDEDGNPVVGAKVQMAGIHNSRTATTDSQGNAVFTLPAEDEYQVVVVWLPSAYKHLAFQTVYMPSGQKEIILNAVFPE